MKKYLIILLIAFLTSCADNNKNSNHNSDLNERTAESIPPGNIEKERDAVQTDKEEPKIVESLNGKYRKLIKDKPAEDCNCNCIEISFDKPTEWCIVKDKIYITARTRKTGENSADLFLVGPSKDENSDRSFPWKDFDTNTPIATIVFHPDGSADLDWKGFSTNGEIATDYAIYGKKTLEGKYKKE